MNSNKRCFGHYRCKHCRKSWMSANCWPGYYQECKTCKGQIYPHRMTPLEKPQGLDKGDPTKNHISSLCGKCKALGRNCRQSYYF